MEKDSQHNQKVWSKTIRRFRFYLILGSGGIMFMAACLMGYVLNPSLFKNSRFSNTPDTIYLLNYDIGTLNDSPKNTLIKKGHELFVNTAHYLGPSSQLSFAGNHLSCTNCHLGAGTKPYAAPLIGVVQRFPQYRGRENKMGSIEERINGCMERSMNGRKIPSGGPEMKAMVAYLNWLGRYAPKDGKVKGSGFVKLNIPKRPVDLLHGKEIFDTHCTLCHQKDGQGVRAADGVGYEYPPLWGNDSYNNGAGMTRVITAAQFIKANMPFGTVYNQPVLTDEEAYDVAGYINQQVRPEKRNREADFPNLTKKPVSTPYGPYADTFSIQQHQLGPFQPIMEFYKSEFNLIKSK